MIEQHEPSLKSAAILDAPEGQKIPYPNSDTCRFIVKRHSPRMILKLYWTPIYVKNIK